MAFHRDTQWGGCKECGGEYNPANDHFSHTPTCPLREGAEFVEAQMKGKPLEPNRLPPLPDLIVTRGGVPVADQKQGIADFKAACLASANDRQVGGLHYSKWTYQHWDFVVNIGMHYLVACASKYLTRWRDKGGLQDLEKAIHYLQKAAEVDVVAFAPAHNHHWYRCLQRFTAQLPHREGRAVYRMVSGDYEGAMNQINALIEGGL